MRQQPVVHRTAPHELDSRPPVVADALFDTVIELCEAHAAGADIGFERVPSLFDEVLRQDEEALRQQYADGYDGQQLRAITNLTCLQPREVTDVGVQRFNDELLAQHTREGRACARGECSCACSRVRLQGLASDAVCARLAAHAAQHAQACGEWRGDGGASCTDDNLYLKLCAAGGDLPATLLFVRLLERMRRATSIEFGVPLRSLSPRQAFVSRIVPSTATDSNPIHVDECSVASYHYSAVLYLTTSAEALQADAEAATSANAAQAAQAAQVDFAGGELRFYGRGRSGDARSGEVPVPRQWRRTASLSPVVEEVTLPRRGTAALFSSGWENMHEVASVTAGERYSLPVFFTTQPPPADAPWRDALGARPHDRAARAAALWGLGLMPQSEADFNDFMWHWAELFDPEAW